LDQDKKEHVLKIAKLTSVELLESARPLREILETCKSICKLAGISDENSWIDLEINGYAVKYKTRDDLCQNLPAYRKTSWKFHDLYGNLIPLHPVAESLFGQSTIYHPIKELEGGKPIVVEAKYLEKFNNFRSKFGLDEISKVSIHEGRIPPEEIRHVLEGLKNRIQELLDVIISLLEIQ
jgi:hypothetical protein